MATRYTSDEELTTVASAIRTKGGTNSTLTWPNGFVSAVQAISSGYPEPTGTINIMQNGTINVKDYANAEVNVQNDNILYGTDQPLANQGNDGDVYLKYGLPDGYLAIDYIESSGTQYINTGYIPSQNTEVEIVLTPKTTTEQAVLGSSWALNGFFLMLYNGSFRWHSSSSADVPTTALEKHTVVVNNSSISVDGVTANVNTGTVAQYAISIFNTTHKPGGTEPLGSFKLHSCKIYEDGLLVKALIPAIKNSNSQYGLYDYIGEHFYTNSGTGNFSAGSTITYDEVTSAYVKTNGIWRQLIGTKISDINS